MTIARTLTVLLVSLLALAATPAAGQPEVDEDLRFARSLSRAFQKAASSIEPSVVHITKASLVQNVRRDLFGRRYRVGEPTLRETGLGSGVIIDASGIVLTNNHVIDQGDGYVVRLFDGREVEAELVGSDRALDLAVLRIEAEGPDRRRVR